MPMLIQNTDLVTANSAPGDTVITASNRTGQAFECLIYITKVSGSAAAKLTLVHDVGSGHPGQSAGTHDIISEWQIPVPGQQLYAATVVIFGHESDPDKLTMFLDSGSVECVVTVQIVRFR